MSISIVYDSGTGHTKKQAQAIAEGVQSVPRAEARLIAVADGPIDWGGAGCQRRHHLRLANLQRHHQRTLQAVHGGVDPNRLDAADLAQQDRRRPHQLGVHAGDKLNSLVTLALFAAQHGMVWVGLDLFPGKGNDEMNRVGGWLGAMAFSKDESPELSPIKSDLDAAQHLGKRVAELTQQYVAGRR
jgi:NAD(P)H dehydrogenase (quinone)